MSQGSHGPFPPIVPAACALWRAVVQLSTSVPHRIERGARLRETQRYAHFSDEFLAWRKHLRFSHCGTPLVATRPKSPRSWAYAGSVRRSTSRVTEDRSPRRQLAVSRLTIRTLGEAAKISAIALHCKIRTGFLEVRRPKISNLAL